MAQFVFELRMAPHVRFKEHSPDAMSSIGSIRRELVMLVLTEWQLKALEGMSRGCRRLDVGWSPEMSPLTRRAARTLLPVQRLVARTGWLPRRSEL
jgi:hypothetical protein